MIRAAQAVMGSDHADVDDVVQQSLIALVQALPAFRGESSPGHYALRIVARIAVAARHRAKIRGDRNDESVELDLLESSRGSQSDEVDAERRRAVVRDLLEDLPEEQAETLVLRIALGFSLAEVATTTGAPLNTVRSRIRLAKTALKNKIERRPELAALLEVDS